MENINVILPGGKSVEVRQGATINDVASCAGVKNGIVAAKIDGRAVDLSRPLAGDCSVEWISIDSPEGLDVLRHSTAHLMAQAVQSLFPGTQVTIGPTIDDGFYYDFKRDQAFAPEDLEQIEKRMQELVKSNLKVVREDLPREQAIELFRKMGETYK